MADTAHTKSSPTKKTVQDLEKLYAELKLSVEGTSGRSATKQQLLDQLFNYYKIPLKNTTTPQHDNGIFTGDSSDLASQPISYLEKDLGLKDATSEALEHNDFTLIGKILELAKSSKFSNNLDFIISRRDRSGVENFITDKTTKPSTTTDSLPTLPIDLRQVQDRSQSRGSSRGRSHGRRAHRHHYRHSLST